MKIKNEKELRQALVEFERLKTEVDPINARLTDLRRAATEYAIERKIDVVQLDNVYFRQIQRTSRFWAGFDSDIPADAPDGAKSLFAIVKGKKVKLNGKLTPLWQLITKRIPDPERIQTAVAKQWISQEEIGAAFLEKPQTPFLQRYEGVADGNG
jgi:hypothetical protein